MLWQGNSCGCSFLLQCPKQYHLLINVWSEVAYKRFASWTPCLLLCQHSSLSCWWQILSTNSEFNVPTLSFCSIVHSSFSYLILYISFLCLSFSPSLIVFSGSQSRFLSALPWQHCLGSTTHFSPLWHLVNVLISLVPVIWNCVIMLHPRMGSG